MSFTDEELTAYHECGHAVVAFALGARIESITLFPEDVDDRPRRFGEAIVNWGRVDANGQEQLLKEMSVAMAGPMAESLYRGEAMHPALVAEYSDDWDTAWQAATKIIPSEVQRMKILSRVARQISNILENQEYWAAVAALSDELMAHEQLDEDQISDCLRFWFDRMA
ncbi:MAG: hypothetical protein AAFP90_06430 [Planctomycetota bacterium]